MAAFFVLDEVLVVVLNRVEKRGQWCLATTTHHEQAQALSLPIVDLCFVSHMIRIEMVMWPLFSRVRCGIK